MEIEIRNREAAVELLQKNFIDVQEIMKIMNWKDRQRVTNYERDSTKGFPKRVYEWTGKPVWLRAEFEEFRQRFEADKKDKEERRKLRNK